MWAPHLGDEQVIDLTFEPVLPTPDSSIHNTYHRDLGKAPDNRKKTRSTYAVAGFLLRVHIFNNVAYRNVFIRQAVMRENLADLVNQRNAVRNHISLLTVSITHQSVTLLISQTNHMVFVFKPYNKLWQKIKCDMFPLCVSLPRRWYGWGWATHPLPLPILPFQRSRVCHRKNIMTLNW